MSQEFFYLDGDNNQIGPVGKEQLKSVVKPDTLVWSEGMEEWKSAKEVSELKSILTKPPPIPKIDKAIPTSSMMKLVYGAIAAGVITVGSLLYINSNSDSSSSGSSIFGNLFGKNYLSGIYEPVDDDSSLIERIEFFKDGTSILTMFGMESVGAYTIKGNKVVGADANQVPLFEIKDANTLVSLPVPMLLDRGGIWKKVK